jgi:hypothetical protein
MKKMQEDGSRLKRNYIIVPVLEVASSTLPSQLLGVKGATVAKPVIPEQQSRKTLSIVGQQSPERAEQAG